MLEHRRQALWKLMRTWGLMCGGLGAIGLTPTWAATPPVAAGTYRCELPSDRIGAKPEVRYQRQACEGGQVVRGADIRTEAQRAQTTRATRATVKLATELEHDRQRLERESRGRLPASLSASPKLATASADLKPESKSKSKDKKEANSSNRPPRPFTARIPKAHAKPGSGMAGPSKSTHRR